MTTEEERKLNEQAYVSDAHEIINNFCTHNNAKGIRGIGFVPQQPKSDGTYDLDKMYLAIEAQDYDELIKRAKEYGEKTKMYDESFVSVYARYVQDVFFNYAMDNDTLVQYDTAVNVLPPNKYCYKKLHDDARQAENQRCWLVNEVNKKVMYNRKFQG